MARNWVLGRYRQHCWLVSGNGEAGYVVPALAGGRLGGGKRRQNGAGGGGIVGGAAQGGEEGGQTLTQADPGTDPSSPVGLPGPYSWDKGTPSWPCGGKLQLPPTLCRIQCRPACLPATVQVGLVLSGRALYEVKKENAKSWHYLVALSEPNR